jgi:hypothetical protein
MQWRVAPGSVGIEKGRNIVLVSSRVFCLDHAIYKSVQEIGQLPAKLD